MGATSGLHGYPPVILPEHFSVEGGRPALDDSIPAFAPRDLERVGARAAKYRLADAPGTAAD